MIEVKNLVKTFKSKGDKEHKKVALNNMSFCIEKTGMVFVLGKSGSGKSTLLNIIGGLDTATSGEIIINGTNIEKLNQTELNRYRALNISFIFQDHHLINSLTVYENIVLSLNAINKTDDGIVDELLKKVDLFDAKNKYPYELSGGMRQRVAVCRALAKNPEIILCDEPTGNLDDTTAKLVLDILKDLSKEKLILIVSHNIVDALKYGDRIIEIFNGEIIKDTSKTEEIEEGLQIKNNTIYLPHRVLNKAEVKELNNIDKPMKFKLKTDSFVETKFEPSSDNSSICLNSTKFYRKSYLRMIIVIIKKTFKNILISSLIVSLLIGCFSIFQSLLHFESNQAIIDSIDKKGIEEVIFRKNYHKDSAEKQIYNTLYPISGDEFNEIKNLNLKGDVFKIYSYSTHYDNSKNVYFETMNDAKDFMKNFYTRSTLGTIECNEEYLKKKFAIEGELKYVGDIYDKVGVIITDYIADYIIAAVHDTRFSTYESLLGPTYFTQYNRCYAVISAIIYTDYKEKHSDAYNAYLNPELTPENYFSDERFYDFCDDVRNRLAYNYYIAGDFMEGNSSVLFQNAAKVVDSKKRSILPLCNFEVHSENGIVPGKEIRLEANSGVKSGEIAIPYQAYNIIFNASVTRDNLTDFEPKTVKIVKRYDPYDETSPIFFEKEFIIFLLFDGNQNEYYISNNDFQDFFEHTMINFSVLFTNTKDANTFLNAYNDTYIIEDADTTSIVKVNAILELYDGLCKFVEILLLALCILCIVFFCINNIKDNKHDIGIMKAMGIKDTSITSMIFVQNCVLGLMIIILANIASFVFAKIGNILLINSLKDLTNTYIHNLIIVQYYPALILFDIIFSFIVIFIASIIPLILLRKFKPIEIIKAKE